MNIKDPLNPFEDTRKRDEALKIAHLIKKKAVYKTNYELVMGHTAAKSSNVNFATTKTAIPTRKSGGTLNGIAYR
tara:strand:+ start:14239 stop:14463 length:225 start_codon:yes stop_codon:yes gene_type:complete